MKTRLFTLIRMIISLCLITFLLWTMRGKWAQIIGIIKNIDIRLLAIGGIFFISAPAILACRLRYLLNTQNILLNYREAASLTYIGYFFNSFLPTSIGGDVVKAYYASRKTKDRLSCFATIFMDRLFGVFSLFLLAALVVIFANPYRTADPINRPIFIILAALVAFFFIMWNKKLARLLLLPVLPIANRLKLNEKLKRAYDIISSFKHKKRLIAGVFIISITAQVISFSSVYFWLKGMGAPVPLRMVLLTMPLIVILCILPSINGLGIREGAVVFLFGPHIGKENAFALSLLLLFMLLVLGAIGGLNYAFGSRYKLKVAKEEIK